MARRQFGQITRLPSKRYRARYADPEGRRAPNGEPLRHNAPWTFDTKLDAEAWLADERRLITSGTWTPPADRAKAKRDAPMTLGDYAESWLKRRDLKARTRDHYRTLLDRFILPHFGHRPIADIRPTDVADWHHDLATVTGPTYRAHAYSLLRSICLTAVDEQVLTVSPCRVRGAGTVRRAARKIEPASLAELETLTLAMPERLRAAVMLAAWCALRFGEVAELRRRDIDLKAGVVKVRRGVTRAGGTVVVDTPKSAEGTRDVAIPPHLVPMLREHLTKHCQWGTDGLLFPDREGGQMAHSSMMWHFHKAREAAGRPDLTFHGLRHTGAVLAAQSGATLKELMARLGHSTPAMAIRYQHVAQGRDAQIAARLSQLATGDTPQ